MAKAVIFDMYETLATLLLEPRCLGYNIAETAQIPYEKFRPLWVGSEPDRMTGRKDFYVSVKEILLSLGCYSDELLERIKTLREESRRVPFENLNPGIIPMMEGLKERNVKVALLSNCSTEEASAIRRSPLWKYFDTPVLSCEVGIEKPDERVFHIALDRLGTKPEETIYVGDGGSNELEAARKLGMIPLQACWYLQKGSTQPVWRLEGFPHLETPLDLLSWL